MKNYLHMVYIQIIKVYVLISARLEIVKLKRNATLTSFLYKPQTNNIMQRQDKCIYLSNATENNLGKLSSA